jgi:Zn-finger domain-containing protein
VEKVYEEWYNGLSEGSNERRGPAMGKLEEKYGTAWRKEDYIRKRFQRRQTIIRRLTITAERLGISNQEAARKMELWRSQKKMSLDKLQKQIMANQELWGSNDLELNVLN